MHHHSELEIITESPAVGTPVWEKALTPALGMPLASIPGTPQARELLPIFSRCKHKASTPLIAINLAFGRSLLQKEALEALAI